MSEDQQNMLDSGHPIAALPPDVQSQVDSARGDLENAAAATGMTGLDIVAPIAREMNETDIRNHHRCWLGPLLRDQQHRMAFHSSATSIAGDLA